jgi:hypothetical protein
VWPVPSGRIVGAGPAAAPEAATEVEPPVELIEAALVGDERADVEVDLPTTSTGADGRG